MLTTSQSPIKSHKVRTVFASLAGTIAVSLVLLSITIVWLNRTLTDTATFSSTVAPLVTQPAVQNFIAEKVTEQVLQSAPTQDLARALLDPVAVPASATDAQLQTLLKPVITSEVTQLVGSAQFATLWKTTTMTAHASLVTQLNTANLTQITLDLTPAVNGALTLLQASKLAPVAAHINVQPGAGVLTIKSDKLTKVHQYYQLFQELTIVLVVVALLMFLLAVWLSIHHAKTLRRILLGVGIVALVEAAILMAPSVVSLPGGDLVMEGAAKAVIGILVYNLLIANLVIGVGCIVVAIASKLYTHFIAKTS